MRKFTLIKISVATLCAVLACYLPQELAKPHEVTTTTATPVQAVKPLDTPKVELVAKLDTETITAPVQAPQAVSKPSVAPSDGNADKLWIYQHESGNDTTAINEIGACGLGQALPCSKMGCSLYDYACQDAWFTQYMLGRYGSWSNAKAFWVANHYW